MCLKIKKKKKISRLMKALLLNLGYIINELRFKKLNKGIIKYCNKLDTYLLEHLTAAWCYFSEQGFL